LTSSRDLGTAIRHDDHVCFRLLAIGVQVAVGTRTPKGDERTDDNRESFQGNS